MSRYNLTEPNRMPSLYRMTAVMPYALGARSPRLANQRATRGATVV